MSDKTKTMELAPMPQQAVARPAPTVADMLQAVVERGVTEQNVAAVKEIVALYERMQEQEAAKAFSVALAKLQSDVKNVKAIRPCTVNGVVRYMFAPYEDLMDEVKPHLQANGFSVSFSSKFEDRRITKILHLRHCAGHVESNDYSCVISKQITNRDGNAVVSESQMESMASTTAKRGALCDALNIVIEKYQQDDPKNEGATISNQLADELEHRIAMVNGNKADFLKLAGAASCREITTAKYEVLDQLLRKKEARGR